MRFWSESRQVVEATVAQTSGLVNYFFFRQTGFCDHCACFNRFPIPILVPRARRFLVTWLVTGHWSLVGYKLSRVAMGTRMPYP